MKRCVFHVGPVLVLVAAVCFFLAPSTAFGASTGEPCDPGKDSGCPDFRMKIDGKVPFDAMKADDIGVLSIQHEFSATMGQKVIVILFKPKFERYSADLGGQALDVLKSAKEKIEGDEYIAVIRTYWTENGTSWIDNYIFLRPSSTDAWRRNGSGALAAMIIQSNLQ